MNKFDIAKKIAKILVGTSTSFTVAHVIKQNADPKNALQTAEILIGAASLGMVAAQLTEEYTGRLFDETRENFRSVQADQK